jgi:hypothetical protein
MNDNTNAVIDAVAGATAAGSVAVGGPAVYRSVKPRRERFQWGRREFVDRRSGRKIWQLTSGDATSHCPYFYCQAFDADEQGVLVSSMRSGSFQLYFVNIHTGEAVRLSDADSLGNLGPSFTADGVEAYYTDTSGIYATNIRTGETRLVTSAAGRGGASFTFDREGQSILLNYADAEGRYTFAVAPTDGSMPIAEPVAYAQDVTSICHVNRCPSDPDLVTYVPFPDRQDDVTRNVHERARTRMIDLRTGKSKTFLTMPPGFRATHEYWDHAGQRMFFHKKHVPNWTPASISSSSFEPGSCTSLTIRLPARSIIE